MYYQTGFTGLFSEIRKDLTKLGSELRILLLKFCPKKQRPKSGKGCYKSKRIGFLDIYCLSEKIQNPSLDGTDTSTALKVLVILVPIFLYCVHLCRLCFQSKNTSFSRITSKHAYAGK